VSFQLERSGMACRAMVVGAARRAGLSTGRQTSESSLAVLSRYYSMSIYTVRLYQKRSVLYGLRTARRCLYSKGFGL
jgi:hypothetical protein